MKQLSRRNFITACTLVAVSTFSIAGGTPNLININIEDATVNAEYVSLQFSYDSSCMQAADGYDCGSDYTKETVPGIKASDFNQHKQEILGILQNLTVVSNASDFPGGSAPYIKFGASDSAQGPVTYPSSCMIPTDHSGNYKVVINKDNCHIIPA